MKNVMVSVEVVAHFDTDGVITPYKVKYEYENKQTLTIYKILKHDTNINAGNIVEIYECIAKTESSEIYLSLNYEKKINKWFLAKI